MAISLKKWESFSDTERLEYIRKGRIIAKSQFDISVKSNKPFILYVATCRGIQISIADTEDAAIRDGQKWLSEWDGSIPEHKEDE